MDKEYRDRLLATSEEDAAKLPREQWYDRIRYIREIIGMEAIKKHQARLVIQKEKKIAPRGSNGHIEAIDDWRDKL